MTSNYLLLRIARLKKRCGFTLVELLVVIAIIAILAGVALGPITNGIKQAKHNVAMQGARTVGQLYFNYSTDNTSGGNRYPYASSGALMAQLLLTSGFATDSSIFVVTSQSGTAVAASSSVASSNCSWAFTTDSIAGAGLLNCGETIPLVYFNNGAGSAPFSFSQSAYSALNGSVGGSAPQAYEGCAVYYKGNNATYIKSTGSSGSLPAIISASNSDTLPYKQSD